MPNEPQGKGSVAKLWLCKGSGTTQRRKGKAVWLIVAARAVDQNSAERQCVSPVKAPERKRVVRLARLQTLRQPAVAGAGAAGRRAAVGGQL